MTMSEGNLLKKFISTVIVYCLASLLFFHYILLPFLFPKSNTADDYMLVELNRLKSVFYKVSSHKVKMRSLQNCAQYPSFVSGDSANIFL
jgi:hypothetical protein